jgi:predicted AAA+ superfamily ATPase
MYRRDLTPYVQQALQQNSAVTLLGPRQSGKTTLARSTFPEFEYLSLEEPDHRQLALSDPRAFFAHHRGSLILDEVQRAPELLSYLQGILDAPDNNRQFVLTGSHNLLLTEKVSQTLAGRTRLFSLLPLSQAELVHNQVRADDSLDVRMLMGGYPRIYDRGLSSAEWLGQYYVTYVERDVRLVSNIGDLDTFDRFVRLTAGRVGQLLNLSSLASDCGISQPTAAAWLSVLKTSYVAFTLEPHFQNFSRRIIKSPKPYFYDTGLLCHLLRINTADHLFAHPLRGAIFENWVVVETLKSFLNTGAEAPLYFWRDSKGNEVDLIIDRGDTLEPIEVKSTSTFHPSLTDGLRNFNALRKRPGGTLRYAGDTSFSFQGIDIRSWRDT